MKSKKVLIGLILAAFVGTAGISVAQTKANYQNNLIEVGPDNIGGRVRAMVADQSDPEHTTFYAGGVAGGLFKWADGATAWDYVPYMENGKQYTLPISYMIQTAHDNMIYIATGEGMMVGQYADSAIIVPKGKGVLAYNPAAPAEEAFSVLPGSQNMEYVNRLASLYRNDTLYLYAGTNDGLYRWVKAGNAQFGNPQTIFTEGAVQDIEIVSANNMAFFSSFGNLFKISKVTGATNNYVDMSTTCSAFGSNAIRIELAAMKADKTYLYAMVTNADGKLNGVYLTTNQTQWTKLTTATINPFSAKDNGWHASSLTIDPSNVKRIIIGGATLWIGEGFVEGSNYQWTQASNSEDQLNGGSFMEHVLPTPTYVHSGIHQILPVAKRVGEESIWHYYMSTDAGIFKADWSLDTFTTMNKGFNTVQYNGIAIAPDGSIVAGALDNACTFIQSRNDHDGGNANNMWYDQDSRMNHVGNTVWFGDGGQVEASMFQQITPINRRGLFFSSRGGDFLHDAGSMGGYIPVANFGRAYADYFNYTNTQTWTSGEPFIVAGISNTNAVAQMALFETMDNQANDSVDFVLDTLGNFIHNGQLVSFQDYETLGCTAGEYTLKNGDTLIVPSKLHFNYPFKYAVKTNMKVKDHMRMTLHNPIASRYFISGVNSNNQGRVVMTMQPTDYSAVYGTAKPMVWYTIYQTSKRLDYKSEKTGYVAPSTDGDAVFVSVADTNDAQFYVVRIANLNAANANGDVNETKKQLEYYNEDTRVTVYDTLRFDAENYRFDRPITSLSVANMNGNDALLVTFGGESATEPNVVLFANVNNPATRTIATARVNGGCPVYSGLIECTTNALFVGTEQGVFKANSITGTWQEYGDFRGVPVTAIRQQTRALPRTYYLGHNGINEEHYLFAKTKYPYAIYFGTFGRGIFMDTTYVVDHENEISNPDDWTGINTVNKGENVISVYPNPAADYANVDMTVVESGNAVIRVYDFTGKVVLSENLGRLSEGAYTYKINCQNLRHGMYLINMNIGSKSATTKLIVR